MNSGRLIFFVAIVAWSLFAGDGNCALGQETDSAPPPKVAGEIQYVGPDAYLLLDAQGRAQPVLGMSYEEFVAAWKQLERVDEPSAEPRFTIDKLEITGAARDDRAELDVELDVTSHIDGPIQLPIGMADAILLDEPQIELKAKAAKEERAKPLVGFDSQAGGYVVRISGVVGQQLHISLKMLRPLVRDGGESSLALNLPRALVSRFSLDVGSAVEAASTTGGVLDQERSSGDGTRLIVTGPTGDVRLSWRATTVGGPDLSTVLSATGVVAITIDGHSIRSDARLSIRSYGGAFERFRVRLPPGAQLIQDRPAASAGTSLPYRLVFDQRPSSANNDSQIVTVELSQKQRGPVDIELSTEQPLGLSAAERSIQLAGFEVLGAVRQYGDVAVTVADDWQLRWENGTYVRQVGRGDLPAELRERQPSIAFQYDRQPWTMQAQLVMRPMMIHVAPAYHLEVGEDEARLGLHLDYQVPGARTFEFRVDLAGWELTPEPIESENLVDRDRVLVTRDGVLTLPLAQASSRRATIDLELRRSLDRTIKSLKLPLPAPIADTLAPAELNVVADPTIELVPDSSSSLGISPTPIVRETPLPPAPAGQQVFGFQANVPGAVLAAERTVRPGEVSVNVATQLAMGVARFEATQQFAYQIKYRPITELAIELPLGWSLAEDQIEITPRGPISEPVVVAATTSTASPDRPARVALAALSQPYLGPIDVRVRYEIDAAKIPLAYGANRFALPQPLGARVAEHRVTVDAAPEVDVALDALAESSWQSRALSAGEADLALVAFEPERELPLTIEPAKRNRPMEVKIERVWLQSWQAGNTIQDRAAIRFRAFGEQIAVELPPLAADRDVEVLVDGEMARAVPVEIGRLSVEIPPHARGSDPAAESHTLELRYRRPAPEGLVVRHSLTPPQVVGTSTLGEVYWQVALPGDRHIVQTPGQLIPVDPRQWLDVFWGRVPSRSQGELESWAGATSQLGPAPRQNIYLYGGLSPASSIELVIVPRWLIVLTASGLVLTMASLAIYVPALRRAWIVLLLALIIAGLAVAYPEAALVVAQASVLGFVLAALALALRHWTWTRRQPRMPVLSNSTNIRMRTSIRSDSYLTPVLGPSIGAPSTSGQSTAPLVAVPESD